MRKSIFATVLLGLLLADFAQAALPVIDRTDKVHSRRYLDSLNVYNRRSIRVNQSGFRPQDYKYAYVADPKEMTFKVIDANTGKEVSGGGNLSLIKKGVVKPGIHVNGAFNSLKENQLYKFGDTTGTATEDLYRADFTTLNTQGEYYLVVGSDTSATFHVSTGSIYSCALAVRPKRAATSAKTIVFFILFSIGFKMQRYSYFGIWTNFFSILQKSSIFAL